MMERFEVLNDGPSRWVLRDNESDEPCEVFSTKAEADHAMLVASIEAMGGYRVPDTFDEETGRRMTTYTIKL